MKKQKKQWVILGLIPVLALVCYGAHQLGWISWPAATPTPMEETDRTLESKMNPTPMGEPQSESGNASEDELPYDKLFITVERQQYKSGDLQLIIPKLSIDAPVWNGTAEDMLPLGACLYEYAQLPGEGNRNVSIAAHRNGRKNGVVTDEGLFYYIDRLTEGDYLYLRDANNIYRYLYKDTKVVEADDWGPIYSQGFSCLTLTSCEPIGVSTHRIIVRSELDEITPLSDTYEYLASVE